MMSNFNYEDTLSASKEESLAKALELTLHEIEEKQKQANNKITRPPITLQNFIFPLIVIVVYIGLWILCCFSKTVISKMLSISQNTVWIIECFFLILFFLLFLKQFCLWLILVYQIFAPLKIRKRCCFEPCCSEYMKLSIKKYGMFKGVKQGFYRIQRCHFPNGGIDYP